MITGLSWLSVRDWRAGGRRRQALHLLMFISALLEFEPAQAVRFAMRLLLELICLSIQAAERE
jgi:hypothetical protein